MSRLPLLDQRDGLPPDAVETFDAILASRGRITPTFGVLLHSPEVASRAGHLGTYVRFESALEPRCRELAALVSAHVSRCAYEEAAHSAGARREGVSEATLEAVLGDAGVDGLDETEALVVRYGRAILVEHAVDDATFEAARARFGERGVVDLTMTVGYYSMIACMLNAAGVGAE